MDGYKQEIAKIKEVLRENPKGMTVTDISRKIKVNRNSVAKYLDIMRISGHVEMLTFGPAKVFFPSRRVPITNLLNYTSDYIIIIDSNNKITMINDTFLGFLQSKREEIIGENIEERILNIFKENNDILKSISDALDGKSFVHKICIDVDGEDTFFTIRIIPTTFEDGRNGVSIIINNNTNYKVAEKALRESQENFKSLLDKIKKK